MTNSGSLATTQSVEAAAPTNHFHRRLAVCLVLTVFNAAVIGKFAGTLYRATAHNAVQQAGLTLLFAALLGSLARVWLLALRSRTR
jgi:Zn-dependent M28 family amino/carboxypeptidase